MATNEPTYEFRKYSLAEVSIAVGVNRSAIARYEKQKGFPRRFYYRHQAFWDADAVDHWLANRNSKRGFLVEVPLTSVRTPSEMLFWQKVLIGDGCWEWTGALLKSGYGWAKLGRSSSDYAHRISYRLINGEIPDKMVICHRCDNRGCVNPGHLFIGTAQDNIADRDQKGRVAWGERSGMAKLTCELVLEIRSRFNRHSKPKEYRTYAESIGVHPETIRNILEGKTWKQLEGGKHAQEKKPS